MEGYNIEPKDMREVTLNEWSEEFFHYVTKPYIHQQVREDADGKRLFGYYELKSFPIPNPWGYVVGLAIKREFWNQETQKQLPEAKTTFWMIGSPETWRRFQGTFASQFAGDNS